MRTGKCDRCGFRRVRVLKYGRESTCVECLSGRRKIAPQEEGGGNEEGGSEERPGEERSGSEERPGKIALLKNRLPQTDVTWGERKAQIVDWPPVMKIGAGLIVTILILGLLGPSGRPVVRVCEAPAGECVFVESATLDGQYYIEAEMRSE